MSEKRNVTLFQNEVWRREAWDSIGRMVYEAHDNATERGFYNNTFKVIEALPPDLKEPARDDFILAQVAKIASELGEAVAVVQRNGAGDHDFLVELADVVIRIFDLVGFLPIGCDFSHVLLGKMERNRTRPYLHGKRC